MTDIGLTSLRISVLSPLKARVTARVKSNLVIGISIEESTNCVWESLALGEFKYLLGNSVKLAKVEAKS